MSEKENKNESPPSEISLEIFNPQEMYGNREVYRSRVTGKEKFSWRVIYRNTELVISSNLDLKDHILQPLVDIYRKLEFVIDNDPAFLKSLSPVKIRPFYPPEIKKMCKLSSEFNVGPMAAVAGMVNDYLASCLPGSARNLFIENGGDLYIKSSREVITGIYVNNPFFKDRLSLKIKAVSTPCGLCSSSGILGHSLSFGKCDLAAVLSRSSISADAAATAIANKVSVAEDVKKVLDKYRRFDSIQGILIIKDDRIGVWGEFELES